MTEYADIYLRVIRRMGTEPDPRVIPIAVAKGEDYLFRRLKHSTMEHQATITTDAEGSFPLPDDFIQMIAMYRDGEPVVQSQTRSINATAYSPTFYLLGNVVNTNVVNDEVVLQYYRSLPTEDAGPQGRGDAPSLMQAEPALYEAAVLYAALTDEGRMSEASALTDWLASTIESVNRAQNAARNVTRSIKFNSGPRVRNTRTRQ